jgi:hypothetical protein
VSGPDILIRDEGTLVLMVPLTAAASEWFKEHLPKDTPRWSKAFAIGHQYAIPIIKGIEEAGLKYAVQ